MIKKGLTFDEIRTEHGSDGRVLHMCVTFESKVFHIINIYAPNIDDDQFFMNVF